MKTAMQSAAAGLLALTLGALCLADSAPGQGQAVKLETLPWEEFQKLPGTATVQFQGRSMTKDRFLAEVRQKKSRSSPGPRAGADLAKEFEQKETSRIAAKNARLQASRSVSGIPAGKVADTCLVSPRIDSLDAHPPLEPGNWVRINGCSFGDMNPTPPGKVKLFGDFSGGSLDLIPVKGQGDFWEDNSILVKVPRLLSGVTDQNLVQIQVVLTSGKKSNLWQTSFRAAREIKLIPFSELQVTCAKPGVESFCVARRKFASPDPWYSAFGQHSNPGGLSWGTDRYAVSPLINGWEVDFSSSDETSDPQPCLGFAVLGASQLGANARVDVEWLEYASNCPARYYLRVGAMGPKGIPYK